MIRRPLFSILSFSSRSSSDGAVVRRRQPLSEFRRLRRWIAPATAILFLLSLFLPFFLNDHQQTDGEYLKRLCLRCAVTGFYESQKQLHAPDWHMSGPDRHPAPRWDRGDDFQSVAQFLPLFWMWIVYAGRKTRRILLI